MKNRGITFKERRVVMQNLGLRSFWPALVLLAAGALVAASGAWAKPPLCERDKPNQYDPECVCAEEIRDLAVTGRLPTDLATGSAVSVYPQGGAEYVICVPPFWHGGMFYASMGTVRLNPNEKEGTIVTVAGQLADNGVALSGLFNQFGYGFAVVAPPQLLSVPSREADLELLVDVVEKTLGQPTFSYVVGFSQGAIPATRLLERGTENPFSGGISACGPIGSFGIASDKQPLLPGQIPFTQLDYSLQYLVIVDYFFPELKLLRNTPTSFVEVPRVPVSTLATWDDDAVEAVFGDPFNEGKVAQLLNVMSQLGLPVAIDPTGTEPVKQTLAELLEEVTFFVNDYVSDLGGSIFDNSATEYPDFELNAGVRRYSSTFGYAEIGDAVGPYETSGLLPGDPPLVALHNFLDHRVPYEHVPLYALKSDAAGPFIEFPTSLGGIPRYGHCDFTAEEAALALQCLVGVVEAGLPPSLVCSIPPPGMR
jgi:hypothetical protein